MRLNPYGEDPVRLAVDLLGNPPRDPAELTERCAHAGVALSGPCGQADLTEVRRFLERWQQVVDTGEDTERARLLNTLLAESSSYPRLTDHLGDGWHIHYRDDRLSAAGVVKALISVGTAVHLTGRGMHRLGRCALEECRAVFADFTRGGRQRYCSPGCANRDAVRRHRARQSG